MIKYCKVIPRTGLIHQLSKFTVFYNVLVKVVLSIFPIPNKDIIYIRKKRFQRLIRSMKLVHGCISEPAFNAHQQKTPVQLMPYFMITQIRVTQGFLDIVLMNIEVRNNWKIIPDSDNGKGCCIADIDCYRFDVPNRNQSMLGQANYFKVEVNFVASGSSIIMASNIV